MNRKTTNVVVKNQLPPEYLDWLFDPWSAIALISVLRPFDVIDLFHGPNL